MPPCSAQAGTTKAVNIIRATPAPLTSTTTTCSHGTTVSTTSLTSTWLSAAASPVTTHARQRLPPASIHPVSPTHSCRRTTATIVPQTPTALQRALPIHGTTPTGRRLSSEPFPSASSTRSMSTVLIAVTGARLSSSSPTKATTNPSATIHSAPTSSSTNSSIRTTKSLPGSTS